MTEYVDVTIVGASIAGSALAIRLARAGISVALCDKRVFPRRKPCGEGLSNLGLHQLAKLGISELFERSGSPFIGYRIWSKAGPRDICFGSDTKALPHGLGIQRVLLDDTLFKTAIAEREVQPYLGEQIRRAEEANDYVSVKLGGRTIRSRFLALADGCNSFLAARLGVPLLSGPGHRCGLSTTWYGEYGHLLSMVQIFLHRDYEIVCTPVAGNRLNVCIVGAPSAMTEARSQSFMSKLRSEIRSRIGFDGEPDKEVLGCGPIGGMRRMPHRGRVLLVGDACETLDPIAGMGMSHALISSATAAAALVSALREERPHLEAFEQYALERETAVRPLRGFTRVTYFSLKTLEGMGLFHLMAQGRLAKSISRAANSPEPGILRSIVGVAGLSFS